MSFEENRYHTRLREYWNRLRGTRSFPAEDEVDPDELNDIWNSCFLISIDDVTRRLGYRYSYIGNELIEAYGSDPNQAQSAAELVSTTHKNMVQKFDEARKTKAPVIDESEFVNIDHINIRYRSCILPLGSAKGEVTHLIGCMRWKMY